MSMMLVQQQFIPRGNPVDERTCYCVPCRRIFRSKAKTPFCSVCSAPGNVVKETKKKFTESSAKTLSFAETVFKRQERTDLLDKSL